VTELERLLSQQTCLESAGQGKFTLHPKRQRELLAKLGLSSTTLGFLKLCQGIYRSRPENLKFESKKNHLLVHFRTRAELPRPLWDSGPMGLAVLSLSQEYRLTWKLPGRKGSADPNSFSEESSVGDLESDEVEILITQPQARWWHRDWTPAIQSLLYGRFGWVPWTWNQRPWREPSQLSNSSEAIVMAGEGEIGDLQLSRFRELQNLRVRKGNRISKRFQPGRALAVLGASQHPYSETFFLHDGVLLDGERNLLGQAGIVAVVSAEGLTPALNGLSLVHDEAFRHRLDGLNQEVFWLNSLAEVRFLGPDA